MDDARAGSTANLHARIRSDERLLGSLIRTLTVHTTAMFRDPDFFMVFRERIVPVLRTYPFVRLWVAGCSTGEEVYSLAIVLREEGLAERCRIYATDVSNDVVERARAGIYPSRRCRIIPETTRGPGAGTVSRLLHRGLGIGGI